MVNSEGQLLYTDFGLACKNLGSVRYNPSLYSKVAVIGTFWYNSPEKSVLHHNYSHNKAEYLKYFATTGRTKTLSFEQTYYEPRKSHDVWATMITLVDAELLIYAEKSREGDSLHEKFLRTISDCT